MKINEKVLWALCSYGGDGISGVDIICNEDKEQIAAFILESFEKHWNDAESKVEEIYGNCDNRDEEYELPLTVNILDDKVELRITSLVLRYNDGEGVEHDGLGDDALENTLNDLVLEYPNVEYFGYIGYVWSDELSGEAVQYVVSNNKDKAEEKLTFDLIGERLNQATSDDSFWDKLEEELEDIDGELEMQEIKELIETYDSWITDEEKERFLELLEIC